MNLTNAEVQHFKYLIEELLFRRLDDDALVLADLEDELLICAQILGVKLENDDES